LRKSDDDGPLTPQCSLPSGVMSGDDEAGGNPHGVTTAPGLILPFWATLTQDKHGPLGTANPTLPSDIVG